MRSVYSKAIKLYVKENYKDKKYVSAYKSGDSPIYITIRNKRSILTHIKSFFMFLDGLSPIEGNVLSISDNIRTITVDKKKWEKFERKQKLKRLL